jgi:hypothetical protein
MANKLDDRPYLVPFSGISLSVWNSSCDHRNFDSVNLSQDFRPRQEIRPLSKGGGGGGGDISRNIAPL